jgi:chromosomal replication initiation ATPase DnaA
MLQVLKECWSRIQDNLRHRAGDAAYEAWLADLRPVALEQGTFYLEARTRMVADRVQRLFSPVLVEVLSLEVGTRLTIEVLPAPDAMLPDRIEVGPTAPVVDASNQTAFLVLKALLEDRPLPGNLYFFHGSPGVGKTFLLRWWADRCPRRPTCFSMTALTKAFQATYREGRVGDLRRELLTERALVVDEVHRLAGQTRIQEELLNVLRQRNEGPWPTLLVSRWHPRDVWKLSEPLCSWWLSGFVARIDLPGPVARLRYLRALEGVASRNGSGEFVEDLARKMRGSYRDLRRAWALQREGRRMPSQYLRLIEPRSVFNQFRDRVAQRMGVTATELVGRSQARRVSQARKILAYLCVQEGLTRAELGRMLNGRSRAAISYSIKSLEREMAASPRVRQQVEGLL